MMEFTWTVPVALIASALIFVLTNRYFRHKERMAPADPETLLALAARLESVEASLARLAHTRRQA
jgi:hypothetical protein